MKKTLINLYKSRNNFYRFISVFAATVYMIAFLDISSVKKTRDKLLKRGILKNSFCLFWDIFLWYLFFGYDPSSYAEFDFVNKSTKTRLTFLSNTEHLLYTRAMNVNADIKITLFKNNTFELFKKFYHRKLILVKTEKDYDKFIDFIKDNNRFFAKPFDGSAGKGAKIYDISNIQSAPLLFKELVSSGGYVLEEIIEQCPEMSKFNQSSVNTVRIVLVRTVNDIEILFAEIRCGRSGSIVDNGGSGGILIPCDINTGYLCKYGYDSSGLKFDRHPDSKIVFNNFQIPRWQDILCFSKELMCNMPNFRYVGLDIAISNNDLVLVEINSTPLLGGLQGLHFTGFKKELLELLDTNKLSSDFRIKQKEIFQVASRKNKL